LEYTSQDPSTANRDSLRGFKSFESYEKKFDAPAVQARKFSSRENFMKMSNRGFLLGTAGKPKSIGTRCGLKNLTSVKDQIRMIEDSTGIMPGLPKEQYLQRNDPK
jgi:hypothetical protein